MVRSSEGPSVGVSGLSTMGAALARNIASTGRQVVVHNRTTARMDRLVAAHGDEGLIGATDLDSLVAKLEPPRAVICMIASGEPTGILVEELAQRLEPGDVIVDGGNSFFADTDQRAAAVELRSIGYLGLGISGGEQGALTGPSLMPGGHRWAYELLSPVLHEIAATVHDEPCCAYLGPGGAGHFVKMVHNGIEYADMAALAEVVELLRGHGRSASEAAEVVTQWSQGELSSFLTEITARILHTPDDLEADGTSLIDRVSDIAAQKGTGRLAVMQALELGEPATMMAEATMHRSLSALSERRRAAASARPAEAKSPAEAKRPAPGCTTEDLASAALGARIVALAQGFDLLGAASERYGWNLDLGSVARVWRGGCIIRSGLLQPIADAFDRGAERFVNDPVFTSRLAEAEEGWRRTVSTAIGVGTPVPVCAAALGWLDAFSSPRLPTALIQAQRDLFGAHSYQRIDREGSFHSDWEPADREPADREPGSGCS